MLDNRTDRSERDTLHQNPLLESAVLLPCSYPPPCASSFSPPSCVSCVPSSGSTSRPSMWAGIVDADSAERGSTVAWCGREVGGSWAKKALGERQLARAGDRRLQDRIGDARGRLTMRRDDPSHKKTFSLCKKSQRFPTALVEVSGTLGEMVSRQYRNDLCQLISLQFA